MRRAVFLDRDGTINVLVDRAGDERGDSPATPDEFELLPGAGEAIRRINAAGLLTVVVSNQPGIAKGKFTAELLEATTRKMHRELARFAARVDAVFYCVHHPEALVDGHRLLCECRKPKPGLLLHGATAFGIDLRRSYMVGDSMTDVQAGASVGCQTVWLGERSSRMCQSMERAAVRPDDVAVGLDEAVDLILREGARGWKSS